MSKDFKIWDEVFVNTPFGWEPGLILSEDDKGWYVSYHVCGVGEASGYVEEDRMIPRDGTPFVETH